MGFRDEHELVRKPDPNAAEPEVEQPVRQPLANAARANEAAEARASRSQQPQEHAPPTRDNTPIRPGGERAADIDKHHATADEPDDATPSDAACDRVVNDTPGTRARTPVTASVGAHHRGWLSPPPPTSSAPADNASSWVRRPVADD